MELSLIHICALQQLQKAERAKGGVLDMETEVVSSLTSYGPGYIAENLKDLEQIVGLQKMCIRDSSCTLPGSAFARERFAHFIKAPKLPNKVPLPFTKGGGRCAILVPEFPVMKGVLFP